MSHHSGRATVEIVGNHVILLCPYRHLVASMPLKDWAQSWNEAHWSDMTVRCEGALTSPEVDAAKS